MSHQQFPVISYKIPKIIEYQCKSFDVSYSLENAELGSTMAIRYQYSDSKKLVETLSLDGDTGIVSVEVEWSVQGPISLEISFSAEGEGGVSASAPELIGVNNVIASPGTPTKYKYKSLAEENAIVPISEAKVAKSATPEELAALINCISVIDETNNSTYSTNASLLNQIWNGSPAVVGGNVNSRRGFRTAFPFRTFWILDPEPSSQSTSRNINLPTAYNGDPNTNGPIRVNRDEGNAANRSEWFDICGLNNVPAGTYVSLWIDISGSMRLSTVQASYDRFISRCNAVGLIVVQNFSAAGERYIEQHIEYFPPSGRLKIVNNAGNEVDTIQIISGETVTLRWVIFGDVADVTISPNVISSTNPLNFANDITVSPTQNTTYSLTAFGIGSGSLSDNVTVNVYVPPIMFMNISGTDPIIRGSCTTIQWGKIEGDASRVVWTAGNISSANVTGSEQVCPQSTTTFTGKLQFRIGGVVILESPEVSVTVTVYNPPTASISSPNSVNYNSGGANGNVNLSYSFRYANTSVEITPTYSYYTATGGTEDVVGSAVSITPISTSSESGPVITGSANIPTPWNDFGPYEISYSISATGDGGTVFDSSDTTVVIDQLPNNFNIPESEDLIKNEQLVLSPDTEILTELILIDDIDIPVEIKANRAILVDKNRQEDWIKVRSI